MCTKHRSNIEKVNPKVIELVEKIKSRGYHLGESNSFLKTLKKHGITFASGNGMTLEELTEFIDKTFSKEEKIQEEYKRKKLEETENEENKCYPHLFESIGLSQGDVITGQRCRICGHTEWF
jgi:hypothetical protein